MKKILPLALLFTLFLSCKQSNENSVPGTEKTTQQNAQVDLTEAKRVLPESLPEAWNSIADIEGGWTSLERDHQGYVVYKPCNGITPKIKIQDQKLIIYWKLEGMNTFIIERAKIISDKEVKLYAHDHDNENTTAVFTIEIADAQRNLVLWEYTINWPLYQGDVTTYKWITTRKEYEDKFRFVDHACPNGLIKELDFLPLEF
ncbi:MAG: hypothetical protein WC760_02205 [Bacteroidia bacterium]|jgi:hypothetical protein